MPNFFASLNALWDDLSGNGMLRAAGFTPATISGIIEIDDSGRVGLVEVLGRKARLVDEVPALPTRTSAIVAAFLTGNAAYWTIPGPRRDAQRALHRSILGPIDHPSARAVLAFLDRDDHPGLPPVQGFWVIRHRDELAHRLPEMRAAWAMSYSQGDDINPKVRVWPAYPMIRISTRSAAPATVSYDGDEAAIAATRPATAAEALDWLAARPSTVRYGDHALVSWLAGNPHDDPTPFVMPSTHHADRSARPHPVNSLHLAILTARPPARMSLRYYWSGNAALAFARIEAFHGMIRDIAPHFFRPDFHPVWSRAFATSPRWPDMVMAVQQAVLMGLPIPEGVMAEIVRIRRKPVASNREPAMAGILSAWAITTGRIKP